MDKSPQTNWMLASRRKSHLINKLNNETFDYFDRQQESRVLDSIRRDNGLINNNLGDTHEPYN